MNRVLVIHPDDRSTDFLKLIYKDKDYDVITECNISRSDLKESISNHDKIIMLGHGTGDGLLNPKYFMHKYYEFCARPYIIDNTFADLLREKETISIWCNSDAFFRSADIKGFHTSMVVSEVSEQQFILGKVYLNEKEQLDNMIYFSKIVNQCIEYKPEDMKQYILTYYNNNDPVTQYNRSSMIVL